MSLLAFAPVGLGVSSLVVSTLWYVSAILAAPFDPSTLVVASILYAGVLVGSFGALVIGLVLAGGSSL